MSWDLEYLKSPIISFSFVDKVYISEVMITTVGDPAALACLTVMHMKKMDVHERLFYSIIYLIMIDFKFSLWHEVVYAVVFCRAGSNSFDCVLHKLVNPSLDVSMC